ncbi:ANTAR domain-containing protein [Streptomyces cyaneofuscatus]|uniref:ANTAR domain-containing protein n=1 Tax=Streptomyces cyaneofuscatus TaxID=66883 RepID=UPI00345DF60E
MVEFTSTTRQAPDMPAVDGEQPSRAGESELRQRVQQLEQALASHAVIDRACGVLIAWARCSPEEAWAILVRVSQHSNTKARLVAEAVVAAAQDGQMPPGLDHHLRAALKQRKAGATVPSDTRAQQS